MNLSKNKTATLERYTLWGTTHVVIAVYYRGNPICDTDVNGEDWPLAKEMAKRRGFTHVIINGKKEKLA